MKFIPYGRQHISNSDINAVKKVLKNNLITNGKAVSNFEKKVSTLFEPKSLVNPENFPAKFFQNFPQKCFE